ncbi:UvrD-helicase domain-containing protein, partial [Acholeplasma sp. OttesenSCG-928-E16]|nr:UvrD-helicase domain-containing protein [Acholeplasma sp. OttesenSCG-928-E16]
MKDKEYLKKLNEQQLKAVCHVDGPLFVAAGAGTGKTRTLTARLAYLIDLGYAKPSELLAVTFTNKAAKEMKERVANIVGDDAYLMWVLTFHAFGLRFLRKHINVLNI